MDKMYYSLSDYVVNNKLSKNIVLNDIDAYINNEKYNFVYNKLWLCKSQNISCAPIGVYPSEFPIVFKPVYNLFGMSRSYYKVDTFDDYENYKKDGLFWMPFYSGVQINLDIVYDKNKIVFYSALKSYPGENGTFKMHQSHNSYIISEKILNWIHNYFKDYKGCINLELIQDNIIECHLRLNGDFHLYNKIFSKKLSKFLDNKKVDFNYNIPEICMFPFFIYGKDTIHFESIKKDLKDILNNDQNVLTYYFDNIDSDYQSDYKKRALMFSCNDFINGTNIIKMIDIKFKLELIK